MERAKCLLLGLFNSLNRFQGWVGEFHRFCNGILRAGAGCSGPVSNRHLQGLLGIPLDRPQHPVLLP